MKFLSYENYVAIGYFPLILYILFFEITKYLLLDFEYDVIRCPDVIRVLYFYRSRVIWDFKSYGSGNLVSGRDCAIQIVIEAVD